MKIGTIDEVRRGNRWRFSKIATLNPNLLAGLPWIQGSNTDMQIVGGMVRAICVAPNPRVYKHVTGLNPASTYRFRGDLQIGTNGGSISYFRVGTVADLPSGDIFSFAFGANATVNETIVAGVAELFLGIVPVTSPGQYSAIEEAFELLLETL